MIKKIIKKGRILVLFLSLFAFYWFLNSGFLANPFWLPLQAVLFTCTTFLAFKYKQIKLAFWFSLVGSLYILSSVLEIFKYQQFSVMAASTGFGILVILIVSNLLKQIIPRKVKE